MWKQVHLSDLVLYIHTCLPYFSLRCRTMYGMQVQEVSTLKIPSPQLNEHESVKTGQDRLGLLVTGWPYPSKYRRQTHCAFFKFTCQRTPFIHAKPMGSLGMVTYDEASGGGGVCRRRKKGPLCLLCTVQMVGKQKCASSFLPREKMSQCPATWINMNHAELSWLILPCLWMLRRTILQSFGEWRGWIFFLFFLNRQENCDWRSC